MRSARSAQSERKDRSSVSGGIGWKVAEMDGLHVAVDRSAHRCIPRDVPDAHDWF